MTSLQRIDCPVIVLVGPTAIGKTALSFEIVDRFNCEIVSMDSMQVYRYMDIGTAKPSAAERAETVHHLIDIINPDQQYDAARFVRDASLAIEKTAERVRTVLLTGGTGLYQKALLQGLFSALPADPVLRAELQERLKKEGRAALHEELCRVDPVSGTRIHVNDTQRLLRGLEIFKASGKPWSEHLAEQKKTGQQGRARFTRIYQVALTCDRQLLYQRIEQRTREMVASGLIEEVEQLRRAGYGPELPSMQSIGYRHANALLDGTYDQSAMIEDLVRDTRRYGKRQMTWFGKNKDLNWFDRKESKAVIENISRNLCL